jgi:predicted nucleic acid-binding protein
MPDSPPWCVVDTNILIDFYRGNLLEALFALPFTLLVPDVIVAELEVPDGRRLLAWGLHSVSLTGEQVAAVIALAALHRAPSINDLFALVLARTKTATLLTGDRALRELAESEGIDVHGTLWLLDELVRLTIVTPEQAAEGLGRMIACGSRLPEKECRLRMRRWRTG